MSTYRDNALDQQLDIRGTCTHVDNLDVTNESSMLGRAFSGQIGSSASISGSAPTMTVSGLSGMSEQSVGNFLTISGSATVANNGTFLITDYINASTVEIQNAAGVSPDANNGSISWVQRRPWASEDDHNYHRSDRAAIKGVAYDVPVPTFTDPQTDSLLPANLDNLGNAIEYLDGYISVNAVDSVFGRTGDIVAVSGDYNSDQIDNVSAIAGATVSDALETLNALIIGGGGGTVSGPPSTTDNAIARWSGTDGYTIQNSGIIIDDSDNVTGINDLSIGGNITAAGTVDGRDVSVDGATLDSHIADTSIHFTAESLGLDGYALDSDLQNHISDTGNPHSTDIGNLGSGTLAELNTIITDATLDDSGDPRTPTTHASTHQSGGSDAIDGYNLDLVYSSANYTPPVNNLIGEHIAAIDQALATAGTGDVVGPASSTDNAIARYDGVTGKLLQNSGVTITDSGNVLFDSSLSSPLIRQLDTTAAFASNFQIYAQSSTGGGSTGGNLVLASGEGLLADGHIDLSVGANTAALLDETTVTSLAVAGDGYLVAYNQSTGSLIYIDPDSISGTTDHGALSGLSDDDHTQYLLVDGTRAMSGNLDMGSNNIVSVGTVDGRDVSVDGSTLDSHIADVSIHFTADSLGLDGYVLETLQIIAGTGLTGGGDLSSDVTLNVTANVDGSIIVNANDIQVGVINDSQHGNLGGGDLHELADSSQAGFFSSDGYDKLQGIETGAQANTVDSVFGRTGDVIAVAGDYDSDQVDNASAVSGATVSDALETLNSLIVGGGSGTVTGPASTTDNAITRWSGTDGYTIQNSLVTIDDNGSITFDETVVSPVISQADDPSNATAGDRLTIQAQNMTGSTTVGGNLWLQSGTGTTDGDVAILVGSQTAMTFDEQTALSLSGADDGYVVVYNSANNAVEYVHPSTISGGGAVSSVFGRTGDVVAEASDYDASQIDNNSTVPGAFVSNALEYLDGQIDLINLDGYALDSDLQDHINDTANPHATDVGNLGSGTLAELNAIITDATLDDASDPRTPTAHASTHESGGSDALDGYNLDLVYAPSNYISPVNDIVGEHLAAIDDALANSGTVTSVFGRAGDVIAVAGDYDSDQIDNVSAISGATVSDALETLNSLIVGGGSGTVSGPNSTTDNAIAKWSGTDGYTIQNSGVILDDLDNITGINNLSVGGNITVTGTVDGRDVSSDGSTLDSHIADDTIHFTLQDIGLDGYALTSDVVTDHGDLTGLGDDDHTQYLLVDGTRSMSGNLDLGTNNIINVGTVDGRDVSVDGSTLDSHIADASIHFTADSLGLDGYALDSDLQAHITNTNNPHGTDVGNLGSGTLVELNSIITDATLDDSSDPRTPTAHASTHENGGSDEIEISALGTSEVDTALVLKPDGAGGVLWATDNNTSVDLDGYVFEDRELIAGAGLVGGGDLSADRTFDVVANADGSIVVNANDIQIGILATDIQHGNRGGGSLHADATTTVSGFMSGADKTKLDGIETGAEVNTVDSVFGRTGFVVALASDYDASQIDNDSSVPGAFVSDALDYLNGVVSQIDLDGYALDSDLQDHINNTANPHGTDIGNLGSGTLAELNAIITDATLDDSSDPRTPTSHASTHENGGSDEIEISALSTSENNTALVLKPDGAGGVSWVIDEVRSLDGYVFEDRQIIAGAGLTGGGDLSTDRTFDIVANADGSIVVNANDIQVGVISDSQHGDLSGGSLHAVATDSVAGFMSSTDKDKLDNIEAGAQVNTVDSVFGRTGAVIAVAGDYDSDQVDNASSVMGSSVSDALESLNSLIVGGGSGTVSGPSSTTDNAIVRWSGTDGYTIQNSGIIIDDSDNITGATTFNGVTIENHSARHENGGADEIDVTGLSGLLADAQTPLAHASSHITGGSDEIDGDQLDIDFSPSNYTPSTSPAEVTNLDHLSAHLSGIDTAIGTIVTDHGALTGLSDDDHTQYILVDGTRAFTGNIDAGSNNITNVGTVDGRDVSVDGTTLDNHVADTSIHFTADSLGLDGYALDSDLQAHITDTNNPHATDVGNLGSGTLAELNSIITDATLDDSSDPRTPTAHASTHITDGSDEIDGDQIDIDFTPSNYTPSTSPAEVTNVDHLSAHLAGIDAALASVGVTDHGALTGLGDDDHTQYLLVDGTRAMSGDLDVGSNSITNVNLVDGRDVSVDGSTLDTHIADNSIHFTADSLGLDGYALDSDLQNHISDTANPHSTDIGNLGSGTLSELNAIVTDATLDDSSDPRTPTAHASTHEDGGSDEIEISNLATSENDTALVLKPDGAGGVTWTDDNQLTAPTDPADDGAVAIASGGDLTYVSGTSNEDGYALTWNDTGSTWEAAPIPKRVVTVEFALSENVSNFSPYFFTWRATGGDSSTGKRSTSATGMANADACTPYVVPFDAKITKAVLVVRGVGVQNGSVTYPVSYQTDLLSVGFTGNTKIADVDFSIPSGVGVFSPGTTNFRGSVDLNVDIDLGDTLGLQFINGTGASVAGQSRMAFVMFVLEER